MRTLSRYQVGIKIDAQNVEHQNIVEVVFIDDIHVTYESSYRFNSADVAAEFLAALSSKLSHCEGDEIKTRPSGAVSFIGKFRLNRMVMHFIRKDKV